METYDNEDKKGAKFMAMLFCCLTLVTPFWVVLFYLIFGSE